MHKFKGKSGLHYEVGLCILTGHIHWINGPFPCGKCKIFKSSLQSFLEEGERVEANKGYRGDPWHVKCPSNFGNPPENLEMQARVRSRHETVNSRFKNFAILLEKYCHDITEHGNVFCAIAVITQLAIETGDSLWKVDYRM